MSGSDVDLLFLYSEEGQLTPHISYHEFFNRVGKKILKHFRLRIRSAPFFARICGCARKNRQAPWRDLSTAWKTIMLGSAKRGSESRLSRRAESRQPRVGLRFPAATSAVHLPKERHAGSARGDCEHQAPHRARRVGPEKLERDVKLGRGGIRDIEFIVQTLQLIHGARNPFLQEPSMLKALRALRELDLLPHDEVLALDNAYRFLRRVEHRLQIEAEQQTHTVPDEPEPLSRLARSLRFSSASDFTAALQNRMGSVVPYFNGLSPKALRSAPKSVLNFSRMQNEQRKPSESSNEVRRVFMSPRGLARYSKGCARFCWIGSPKLPIPMRL